MQSIVFCSRCRGIWVGWNPRYLRHCVTCKEWVSRSSKHLILFLLLAFLVAFPTASEVFFWGLPSGRAPESPVVEAGFVPSMDPAVDATESFLEAQGVEPNQRNRVAEAIVKSSRKYDVDPMLVASIMIVESRANPFAISSRDAIGIMQIHLPTWGTTADKEGINLLKIEDNVDFGVRILKDYCRRYGLWGGVKKYKGRSYDTIESAQSVADYLERVQRLYRIARSTP